MKRGSRRFVRRQNQQNERPRGPFFKLSPDESKQHNSFFQTQLKTGEKGDKFEKEADQAAENVATKVSSANGPAVQKQDISPVGSGSMKDKEEKSVLKQEEEKQEPVQKAEKKEEEKPIQKAEKKEEEKPIQKAEKKEEEEPVQKKEADETRDLQAKHEEDKKDEHPPIMHKKQGTGATKTSDIAEQIKNTKGNGRPLSERTARQMEKAFDADFSRVVIHTDSEAETLNQEMQSLAFTSGNDIYFAKGQYNPDSSTGKKLLAHELTHVIQQTGK